MIPSLNDAAVDEDIAVASSHSKISIVEMFQGTPIVVSTISCNKEGFFGSIGTICS